jgi:hypothetical protein
MGQRSSVYLADDLAAAVKASGVPLAELVRRGLTTGTAETPQPSAPGPAASPVAAISGIGRGEPSPGVVCMAPACWERNTARYGLRRVPLCPACVSALRGETYQRQTPPGAARLIHHGAA